MNQCNIALDIFILSIYQLLFTLADESCDKLKCPGPLAYYEAIGCKPVYMYPDDCCAYKYNCDEIKSLPSDKCYVNGNEYDIGEMLKEEDANPCDINCICSIGYDDVATFKCAVVDCFNGPVKPGCYRKNSPLNCCPGEEVCPESPEDRATCIVDGKMYKDGEHFSLELEPNKNCVCQPGYKGENVEPFCSTPNRPYCDDYSSHAADIKNNCAPVYYSNQPPQTSCSTFVRCQNNLDKVIKGNTTTPTDDNICLFGSLTMHYGDKLNQDTDYSSVCVQCVCEVGPFLTCQRIAECDNTKTLVATANHIKLIGSSVQKKLQGGKVAKLLQ